jgi:hypothetical protein
MSDYFSQLLDWFNAAGEKSRAQKKYISDLLSFPEGTAMHDEGMRQYQRSAQGIAEGFLGPSAIRAFHGSPHLFNKVDMSKIGSGTGAQAQGHGIYAAENPLVAQSYAGEKGNMYEMNLRWADPAREARDPLGAQHFLNWDAPLTEQPQYVRDVLASDRPQTGAQFYHDLALATSRPEASNIMLRSGIPGVRYLDAGSRGRLNVDTGPQTSNYVMFDPDMIEILKRSSAALFQ